MENKGKLILPKLNTMLVEHRSHTQGEIFSPPGIEMPLYPVIQRATLNHVVIGKGRFTKQFKKLNK